MNYLGEMMLYASFAVLVQRIEVWIIYGYMWGVVFMIRMLVKDYSNSKKAGWPEYYEKTWLLIPKLFNSTLISIVVYGIFAMIVYTCLNNGGMEATLKALVNGTLVY